MSSAPTRSTTCVTVELRRPFDAGGLQRNFFATSSCGVCGKASIDQLEVRCAPLGDGPVVERDTIAALPDALREGQRMFEATGGLHATGLFTAEGQLIALREDVGRHNAMDKLVGERFLAGATPLGGHIALVSGRTSFELVQKAAVAGIPILCSVSAPSSLAVETARALGLTLVGFVRGVALQRLRARRPDRAELMATAVVRGAGLEEARGLWSGTGMAARTPLVRIAVADALGEVLAAPLTALIASPPAPVSAMDGLAVLAAETAGERTALPPGRYARIDTGEPIPAPFDAVVMIERVALARDGSAQILEPVSAGQNVRRRGEHLEAGEQVVPAGRALGPFDIAAAIAGGHAHLEVHRRPIAGVLATGNELRAAGRPLGAGQVHDGNGPMIAAQIQLAGGTVQRPPLLGDDVDRIAAHLTEHAQRCDLVLLLGGSSRGRRDCARAAIERSGQVLVEGVSIRPGHPTILGVVDETPVMGVPGYPLAAAVAVHLLAIPLMESLRGAANERPRVQVELAEDVPGRPDAVSVVPLSVESQTLRAHPLSRRGSNIAGLAAADALLCLPPGESRRAGESADVERLRPWYGHLPGSGCPPSRPRSGRVPGIRPAAR